MDSFDINAPRDAESETAKSHRLGEMHDLACQLIAIGTLAEALWALRQAYEDAEAVGTTGADKTAEIALLTRAMAPAEEIGAPASCGMCAVVAPLVQDPFGGTPVCAACRARASS